MNLGFQEILSIVIVALAVVYVARRIARRDKSGACKTNCCCSGEADKIPRAR